MNFFIVLCALINYSLSDAFKWCYKKNLVEYNVTQMNTKIITIHGTLWQKSYTKMQTFESIKPITKLIDVRTCCDGYIPTNNGRSCTPICSDGCPKMADCIEPNRCKCHSGYHLEDGLCRLDCGECTNGRCSDLGICQCNAMYARINDTCNPLCRNKCTNGFCAAPNICECNPGYEKDPQSNHCEPICSQACGSNAYCMAPEVCSCKIGFSGNSTDACQPWCKAGCKNGDCMGPDKCQCYQGFAKVDGLCIPDCQSGCKFGDCLDENVCHCWPGFVYNNSTGSCQESLDVSSSRPDLEKITQSDDCVNECYNGSCKNGECFCHEGFVKVDFLCFSLCLGCRVGDCVEEAVCKPSSELKTLPDPELTFSSTTDLPTSDSSTSSSLETTESVTNCSSGCWAGTCKSGVCQCPDGLILNGENDCIMPCEAGCKNGVCTQGNICECRDGYLLKDSIECIPQCDKECVNGFCVEPNLCECLEGYIPPLKGENICSPTCNGLDGEEGCINGTCVAVNKCQCLEGFMPKTGNRFECIPFVYISETNTSSHSNGSIIPYIILGVLTLLLMSLLGLFVFKKFYRGSYNVAKIEKGRGIVQYRNGDQVHCMI